MKYLATVDGHAYDVGLEQDGLTLDGTPVDIDLHSIDGGFHYSLLVGTTSHELFVERCGDICFVTLDGQRYQVKVEDERAWRLSERQAKVQDGGDAEVTSPMPGVVVAVLVEVGQEVLCGERLLILEAMKMENEILAPRNGLVDAVHVTPGQRVSQDDGLVRIEAS
jgi:biotin carboxyl carrier protein